MNTLLRGAAFAFTIAAAAGLGACQGGEDAAVPSDSRTIVAGSDTMQGMQGGMSSMMGQMHSHMATMQGASADSIRSMMPMHRQMAANMIAGMNREMQSMNMSGDAAWIATIDSVRQDLIALPELSGAELATFMQGHHRRMMRLMEAHRAMMANMKM